LSGDGGDSLTTGNGRACAAASVGFGGIAGDVVGGAVGALAGFGVQTFGAIGFGVPGVVLDISSGIDSIRHFCGGE